jgi:dethiobiotin synthetase
LAEALHPERVVLVAEAGLGTINAVRLATAALAEWPVSVVLNRFEPALDLHQRTRAWLAERDGFHVVVDGDDLVAAIVGWPSA